MELTRYSTTQKSTHHCKYVYARHVLIKFLNALQMELTVPFLMGCLERSIVNGKRKCVVFDAAVGASGYVSGYTRPRRTVCPQCAWTLYAVAAQFHSDSIQA